MEDKKNKNNKIEEFKVGGKITLNDEKKYLIIDIVIEENKKYYVCVTMSKPILPIIFEKKEIDRKIYLKKIEDEELITKIAKREIEVGASNGI